MNQPEPSPTLMSKWMQIIVSGILIITTIMGLGAQWARVSNLEARVNSQQRWIDDQRNVQADLTWIKGALDRIEKKVDKEIK